jgi:protein gp37
MAEHTEIAWADSTFNPWIGCTKVGPGCDHCYAEARMDKRLHHVQWGLGQPRSRTQTWGQPVKWNREHEHFFKKHGRRQRVFCASLADVFDNEVAPIWRADLFQLIDATPHLDWLLLTKRIGNVSKMLTEILRPGTMPKNVWLGATVVNQEEADRDIPKLLATPARVRFLSMEPLLGPVDLQRAFRPVCDHGSVPGPGGVGGVTCPACEGFGCRRGVDWVIVGGESGPHARRLNGDHARSLRDQCAAAGVPFLFKQWGDIDERGIRMGKKASGRVLDGVVHDGFPVVR